RDYCSRVWAASMVQALSVRDALPIWRVRPPERWRATGVFIHPEGFLPGRVAAVRLQGVEKGVAPGALAKGAIRPAAILASDPARSEEHTSELQSRENIVCRLLLEKKK